MKRTWMLQWSKINQQLEGLVALCFGLCLHKRHASQQCSHKEANSAKHDLKPYAHSNCDLAYINAECSDPWPITTMLKSPPHQAHTETHFRRWSINITDGSSWSLQPPLHRDRARVHFDYFPIPTTYGLLHWPWPYVRYESVAVGSIISFFLFICCIACSLYRFRVLIWRVVRCTHQLRDLMKRLQVLF